MRWLTHDPIGYEGGSNLYEYVGGNPVGFVDPEGTLPVKNNSGRILPYKPENKSNIVNFCEPGEVCDMDGFFPPDNIKDPQKVRDTCLGAASVDKDCSVTGFCIPFITQDDISKNFFKARTDWPDPYSGENGWPTNLPLIKGKSDK